MLQDSCRIPLYYELKLVLILWLIMPGTRGAEVIYKDVIYKILHEYASKFDPTFSSSGKVCHDFFLLTAELDAQLFPESGLLGFMPRSWRQYTVRRKSVLKDSFSTVGQACNPNLLEGIPNVLSCCSDLPLSCTGAVLDSVATLLCC